jgi:hypothetical protein
METNDQPSVIPTEEEQLAARAVLERAQAANMAACMEEVNAVLEKWGMDLQVTPAQVVLTPRR